MQGHVSVLMYSLLFTLAASGISPQALKFLGNLLQQGKNLPNRAVGVNVSETSEARPIGELYLALHYIVSLYVESIELVGP